MPRTQIRRQHSDARDLTFVPNLGLYLNVPSLAIPERGLRDCLNVRIKEGSLSNENLGWTPFYDLNCDGNTVLLVDQFFTRGGAVFLIFGTTRDLYYFDTATSTLKYITPHIKGTCGLVNGDETMTGLTGDNFADVGAGDKIYIGTQGFVDQDPGWREVDSVTDANHLEMTTAWGGSTATFDFTIRLLFDGDGDSFWVAEIFPDSQADYGSGAVDEDEWWATNGTGHSIVSWNGSDDCVREVQGDLGFTCGSLHRHKNMMLYGDLVEGSEAKPYVIRNSALSDPTNVSTDEASEWASSDGIDQLLASLNLGDLVVNYHERSVNLAQYVGDPFGWLVRTAVPNIGPISGRCVVDFGQYHDFIGADTGYQFDGVSIQEKGGHVFREMLRQFDRSRADRAFAHLDEENGDVIYAIPLTTDSDQDAGPQRAYVEHYLEEVGNKPLPITIREFEATSSGFFTRDTSYTFADLLDDFDEYSFRFNDRFYAASFPQNLMGSADGALYEFGIVNHQNGVGILSYAAFPRFQVIDGRQKGVIKRIEPAVSRVAGATYGLICVLYRSDFPAGDREWCWQKEFDISHSARRHLSVRKSARFAEFTFGTSGVDQTWDMIGFAVESGPAGER